MNKLITTNRNKYQGAGLAAIALALSIPAGAQTNEQGPRASMLEEIVVTARRREESLQDVPIDVTALTGDELQRKNITAPSDLQFAAPSVTVQGTLGRVGGSYTVRGVNSGTNARTSAVVPYFSEAAGGPTDIGSPFFDLASVQVLKGPQGTLFGKAAVAGAVLIEPQHPDLSEFGGYLDVTTGDYSRMESTAVFNIPLMTDELAVRIAYHREERDGFTKPIAPSSWIDGLPERTSLDLGEDFDSIDNESVRVGVEWQKGDFNTYLVYNYQDIDQTGPGFVLGYANLGLRDLNRSGTGFEQLLDVVTTESARIQAGGSVRETPALQGLPESQDRHRHKSVINVSKYDFGDLGATTLTAKNIFSYQEDWGVTSYGVDGVGGILLGMVGSTARPIRQSPAVNQLGNRAVIGLGDPIVEITEEFQLQGNAMDTLDYTVGVFYNDRKDPKNTEGIGTLSRSFSGLFSSNQGFTAPFPFRDGSEEEEIAGYGEITMDLSEMLHEGLSLTAGFRRTINEQTERNIATVFDSATGTFIPGNPIPGSKLKFTGNNYRLGVTQQFSPDLMAYAMYSRSFLVGGANEQTGCESAPGCEPVFGPAIVKSYEIGWKAESQLGDADLRWNTSVYFMDFSDIQQTNRFQSETLSLTYQGNIAAAEMKGLQTNLDVAWHDLALSLNYSLLDAKYTDWVGRDLNNVVLPSDNCVVGTIALNCQIDLSGSPFTNAPKHQLTSTVRYNLPVDESLGDIWVQLNGYWQSRQWHVAAPDREVHVAQEMGLGDVTDAISQKSFAKLDARVGWDNILGSSFSGAAFVNNLTDKTYSQAGSTRAYSLGTAVKLYAPPRMWGVSLRYDF